VQNQDQVKRQILNSLEEDEAFIVVDWAMKFMAMKFREKQAEWFAKRGIRQLAREQRYHETRRKP